MFFRAILLSPFALVNKVVLHLRHGMFSVGLLGSKEVDHKLLKVGNLALGGSGKTPFVEYLIRTFQGEYSLGVVSRGYGRKSDDLKEVLLDDNAAEAGDEPLQIKKKFPSIPIFLKGDRNEAISALKSANPKNEVIVLDDALQHRKLRNGFNILLTNYQKPFYKDFLFPSGTLRDIRSRAKKADVIVVSKTPSIVNEEEEKRIRRKLSEFGKPVFFTSIKYSVPKHSFTGIKLEEKTFKNAILVTGIASSKQLKKDILHKAKNWSYLDFGDHHVYTGSDIQKIIAKYNAFNDDTVIFTTEKDAQRLVTGASAHKLKELPIYTIEIETHFLKDEEEFKKLITIYVGTNSRIS